MNAFSIDRKWCERYLNLCKQILVFSTQMHKYILYTENNNQQKCSQLLRFRGFRSGPLGEESLVRCKSSVAIYGTVTPQNKS